MQNSFSPTSEIPIATTVSALFRDEGSLLSVNLYKIKKQVTDFQHTVAQLYITITIQNRLNGDVVRTDSIPNVKGFRRCRPCLPHTSPLGWFHCCVPLSLEDCPRLWGLQLSPGFACTASHGPLGPPCRHSPAVARPQQLFLT